MFRYLALHFTPYKFNLQAFVNCLYRVGQFSMYVIPLSTYTVKRESDSVNHYQCFCMPQAFFCLFDSFTQGPEKMDSSLIIILMSLLHVVSCFIFMSGLICSSMVLCMVIIQIYLYVVLLLIHHVMIMLYSFVATIYEYRLFLVIVFQVDFGILFCRR